MKLINGRGQLGSLFSRDIDKFKSFDLTLYHTWNFVDKTFQTQEKIYLEFVDYVSTHPHEHIVFISTKSHDINEYTQHKLIAENYLFENHKKSSIIKLPNIIGKGICQRFLEDKKITPFGKIELISLTKAYNQIINFLYVIETEKVYEVIGEYISAELCRELILFQRI